MKRIIISLMTVPILMMAAFAEEKADAKKDPIGLTFGIDYYSNYLWRGTKFYNGDGAVVPAISWAIFNTGLTIGVVAELSQSYFWEGFQKKPRRYYPQFSYDDLSVSVTKKTLKFNHNAYIGHSLDPGIDYTYKIPNAVTLNVNAWYWWYYNTGHAAELARKEIVSAVGYNKWHYIDYSYLTTTFGIGLDFVPFINPKITVSHDYYTGLKKGGDFYTQLSLGHDFELSKDAKLTLGGSASYYYNRTNKVKNYYLYFDGTDFLPRYQKQRLRKGVSDVTPYLAFNYTTGPVTLKAGFYWCIVPAKSFYKGDTPHRYYANLGVACAI